MRAGQFCMRRQNQAANISPQMKPDNSHPNDPYPMDKLLAKLSREGTEAKKAEPLRAQDDNSFLAPRVLDLTSSSSSVPVTPATDSFPSTIPTTRPGSASNDSVSEEVLRLKLELAEAKSKIDYLDHELRETRYGKHFSDQAAAMFGDGASVPTMAIEAVPHALPASTTALASSAYRGAGSREVDGWGSGNNSQLGLPEPASTAGFSRGRAIWNNKSPQYNPFQTTSEVSYDQAQNSPWFGRGFNNRYGDQPSMYQGAGVDTYRPDRLNPEQDLMVRHGSRRANRYENRFGPYGGYAMAPAQFESGPAIGAGQGGAGANMSLGTYNAYQLQPPIGTPLSPHATEFTSGNAANWKPEVSEGWGVARGPRLTSAQALATEGQTYLPTTEPLNYRRLLDRNVTCNWKYIVDKIVCNNDQQASIFLQQKLKIGTAEQKYDIVEAIVAQAYPLMVNRFGNFLVQRCFEHGTPEQVIKIAEAIRGNTLDLSMDPFGCHVVQKAFDSVPEDYKAIMVHELLRRIPETVVHRYACHVWQKLFELRWTESPPQIMKYVNEALRGMWHEVALGETGSLVVQNIFENCLEEDKVCGFPPLRLYDQ